MVANVPRRRGWHGRLVFALTAWTPVIIIGCSLLDMRLFHVGERSAGTVAVQPLSTMRSMAEGCVSGT
jgi:hypothetical protein